VVGARQVIEVGARWKRAAIFYAAVGIHAVYYKYLIGGGMGVVGLGAAGLNLDEHALFARLCARDGTHLLPYLDFRFGRCC
jgi:hypothetical protein